MNNIPDKIQEELSLTVNIAEKPYKLRIKAEEEENVRKAAKRINEEMVNLQKVYKNKDKQDLLAMIALANTSELVRLENNHTNINVLTERLLSIDKLLEENSDI